MIPLRDVIPSRTFPGATLALIALNALAFAVEHPVAVAANMLALWLFGGTVEDRMGRGRFVLFYVLCGVAGAATPGAAAGGVIGAYFVLYPRSRVLTLIPIPFLLRIIEVPAFAFAAGWVMVQALVSGSGVWRHAAGVAAGIGTVWLFRRRERLRVEWWNEL